MAAEEREKTTGSASFPRALAALDVLPPTLRFQAALTITSTARAAAKRVRSSVRPPQTTVLASVSEESVDLAAETSMKAGVRLDWRRRRLRAAAMNVENHLPSLGDGQESFPQRVRSILLRTW